MFKRRYLRNASAALALCCSPMIYSCTEGETKVWELNSLQDIGGYSPIVWGSPSVLEVTEGGRAIKFDGVNDGLLVNTNPIAGAEEFAIEVTFKPVDAYPENVEQRFLHIQDPENENRRILIELRLNDRKQWYADFFMRTDNEKLALIDSTKTHPVNEWATVTLVYKNKQMKGYVNGVEELAGAIEYMPINTAAKTSIGTRMDKRSWFNGEIKNVKFSFEGSPQ